MLEFQTPELLRMPLQVCVWSEVITSKKLYYHETILLLKKSHFYTPPPHLNSLLYCFFFFFLCNLQELCLHTKLLAPVNCPIVDFLMKAPDPPPALIVRNAVQMLKVSRETDLDGNCI